jgi:uncharacterized repeat protein (TIGR01451 family)
MNVATLALLLPLATANPPKWNMAPTPGCASCATAGMPMMPGMMPGAMMPGLGYPPFPQPCPPTTPPAPVLFTKIIVPNGITVTAHPGSGMAKTYTGTQTFGFRPGYRYRLQMTGKANAPLYPVVSVYGSLVPRNGLNYWEFPAPITFSELDLARAALGAQVTKIIYLEDPKKAVPFASKPEEPLEFNEDSPEIARAAAHDSGRVVAIVTIGDRVPDAAELTANAIANTILLPGETTLAAPAAPPPLVWSAVPLYDPIIGPKPPVEECITDGGDKGDRLGFNNAGKIGGLNATDVGVEYTVDGKRKVTTSNEVCICSPRFAIKKSALMPGGVRGLELLDFHTQSVGRLGMQTRLKASGVDERVKPIIADAKLRPMIATQQEGVHVFTGSIKAHVVYVYQGTHQIVSSLGPDEKTSSPNRLVVTKSVTPNQAVQIGDTVTFTIKYENRTPHPISDLVVSDSLSGRLEFVAGSAASDRTTNVTTTPNEAGSVTVRFELPGTLAPGDTGTVQFKAKVR